MTQFDQTVPAQLKKTQLWFGSIIGRPMDDKSQINPLAPSGRQMAVEATDYIAPSPTLKPDRRIELYNQQYWWRLFKSMHETFPFVTRLFGYHDFNQRMTIPYIVKYPPSHWSLDFLGERFSQWIEEEYTAEDKQLVLNAAKIDWAYCASFTVRDSPLPSEREITTATLTLQPHVCLFDLSYNLFACRTAFLKESVEHWEKNSFPTLDLTPACYVLYRDRALLVGVEKIDPYAFQLLRRFEQGCSLDQLCEWLETHPATSDLVTAASAHLQEWFQHWTTYGWLETKKADEGFSTNLLLGF